MREIKFRAWTGATMEYNVTVGKFGAFYVNPGAKGDGLDDKDTACLTSFTTIYSKETPVMQFTNISDFDGKEIWEGDILTNGGGTRFEVKYAYGACDFTCIRHPPKFDMGNPHVLQHRRVIGNIYENPELLKGDIDASTSG